MNILLLFFAIPIAVIIFSIALQKILKCPFLVAGIIFSILLIITFTIANIFFLVATIIYTILSFIVAVITKFFMRWCSCQERRECNRENRNNTSDLLRIQSRCGNNDGNLLTISSNCGNDDNNLLTNDLLTIQSNINSQNNSNNQCSSCNCGSNNGRYSVNARITPDQNSDSGTFSGCYRRRCR